MQTEQNSKVTVVDIQMPFWSMVVFMVKVAIASIPAVIILSVLGGDLLCGHDGGVRARHALCHALNCWVRSCFRFNTRRTYDRDPS
ncbi:hypothetical protein [uncultured Thiocystis sp.]|uniref:hypothetical protein n=1 Tax=uncultured Thiocystis sp. TaxID=1202134 RepID=UPI0025D7EC9B|nr:hypothetical protein [uncultured Thiocystis sp.]